MSKRLIILLLLCSAFNNFSFAQTEIWSVNASDYVGKFVKFEEYVNKVDYNSTAKTCKIFLADPDVANSPTITVVIHNVKKGRHLHWLQALDGFTITITGKLLRAKNEFIINGNDALTKIEPEGNSSNIDPMPLPPVPSPADTTRQQ